MAKDGARHVAIMGGGDWADASVDFVLVPAGVDLEEAQRAWQRWYREEFMEGRVKYQNFPAYLIAHYGAVNDTAIEVFDDGL